ncbi:hypothetical protein WICMUC_001440 [Wickerhamomyces mucosus]|uniref:Transcription factor CBF/NF-Y/archaeal histone domain-containing protein n=1 Tax=Wickerhamomyces mucosus TaxID=1378264 RepID=A0A9P8TG79_9ASCO|nr:hypothetical protein WICMUC_001440 [Wickerhamomyces mucosus]
MNSDNSPNNTAHQMTDKQHQEIELREQDRWLPIANVARLMKNTLPGTAKVSKDAKECMQECVSEFISFITSEASDRCVSEKRKTINGEDILFAMTSLGFENYSEVLKIYLAKYREQQALKQERGETKKSKKHQQSQQSQDNETEIDQETQQKSQSDAYQQGHFNVNPTEHEHTSTSEIHSHSNDNLSVNTQIPDDLIKSIKNDHPEDELLNLNETEHASNSVQQVNLKNEPLDDNDIYNYTNDTY